MMIGSDIDDVLFDWYGRAQAYCERAGITNGVKATQWAMHEDYGCTLQDWLDAVYPMAPDGIYLEEPDHEAVAALKRIHDAGHIVTLITARGAFAHGDIIRRDTVAWVDKYLPWVDDVYFSAEKWKPRTDYFIDDAIKNYDAILAHAKISPTPVLLNRPHNRPWDDGRRRVSTVAEFADFVIRMGEYADYSAARTRLPL